MDEYIKGFMDENDITFNEFFENHKLKILSKNKEYNDLKSKKKKIYDKYPEIMHLIEDSVPMTFDVEKVQAFDSFQIKVPMNAKILGKQFKATGGKVTLSKNGKSIDFIFEVIRREDDWQKKLADKMKLYKDFYENFVAMDSGFKTIPQLILLCEDEKHMAETFREIVVNGLGIDKLNLYYTTDLRQNDRTLEHSLAEFKLDPVTNKYKMENVDIKLLG